MPTKANVFFQALDSEYRSIQIERTYVNYMPGEIRSCVGCHETPASAGKAAAVRKAVKALKRAPSVPIAQPGDASAQKTLDFRVDVQPVLDKYCAKCHDGTKDKKRILLTGAETQQFTVAYEKLRRSALVGRINDEIGPKTGNAEYRQPFTFGSYSSVLMASHTNLPTEKYLTGNTSRLAAMKKAHKDLKLPLAARVQLANWIDGNLQFYGSYWGRRNSQHAKHPNYRPISTFDEARSRVCPIAKDKR